MVRGFFNETNTDKNDTIVHYSLKVKPPYRVTSIFVNLESKTMIGQLQLSMHLQIVLLTTFV